MLSYPRPWQVLCTTTKIQRAQSCSSLLDQESSTVTSEVIDKTDIEKGPETWEEPEDTEALDKMDRVTRYPIFNIPHSSRVSDLPTDLENQYTFDIAKVELVSLDQDKDISEVNSGGQSFRIIPEDTSGLRVMTITQESVPTPHLVQETRHVLTKNYRTNSWTPPLEREVVRMGATYSVRAYSEDRHPGKLYSEEEEEKEQQLYRLDPGENVFLKRKKELDREREAVIRNQVVRRSTTVATRWDSQEELDKIYNEQGPSFISASDSQNVIDTDQINFLAARQQFMDLEKLSSYSQTLQKPMGKAMQTMRASPEVGRVSFGQSNRSYGSSKPDLTNGYTVPIKTQGKDDVERTRPDLGALGSHSRSMGQFSLPSVDDASVLRSGDVSPELVLPDEESKETPIEKEIRRAQEREADLRQQRGLQRSGSGDELVEIQAKPLLSNVNLIFDLTPKKGKDKARPSSLYIQREIALDTKREEDHRRQAGLSEPSRSSISSQLPKSSDIPKEVPKMKRAQSSDSILNLTSDTHPVEATLEGRKISRIPLYAYQPYLNPDSTKMEFPSYSSSKVVSRQHTTGSRWEDRVGTPPPSWQKASWGKEEIKERPWKSQTSTTERQESWRSPSHESTWKDWDAQGRGTLGSRKEEVVTTSSPSWQKASWGREEIKEHPWKSQVSTTQRHESWRSPSHESTWKDWDAQGRGTLGSRKEEVLATSSPSWQKASGGKEEIKECSWKSQTSTTERQESWRSPSHESTWKDWDAQGRGTLGSRKEEVLATSSPSWQKASWGREEIKEHPWKSQVSTTQKQESWRSPSHESTQKTWDTQKRGAVDDSQGLVRWDYFRLRPLKFKVMSPGAEETNVLQQEYIWEPKGHAEEVVIPPKPLRSQSSSLLEMEIQSVLQREKELAEERRNALFPEVFSSTGEMNETFESGSPDSDRSSVASGITGSYSVSEPISFSPVRLHSGLVWKVTDQMPREEDVPWKTKRDTGYAGLDISDTVNTEVVEATRVPRHKNAMAARWEAGMYYSEDED